MDNFIEAITIKYDPITSTIDVNSKMTTFESFGLLEAAKQMIAQSWLNKTEAE